MRLSSGDSGGRWRTVESVGGPHGGDRRGCGCVRARDAAAGRDRRSRSSRARRRDRSGASRRVSAELGARIEQLLGELQGAVERTREEGGAAAPSASSAARSTSTRCSRARSRPPARSRASTRRSSTSTAEGEPADRRDARPLGGGGAPAGGRRAARRPRGALDRDRVPVPARTGSARATPSTPASPCRCAREAGAIGLPDRLHAARRRAPSATTELEALEELASRAGPAIENARRFREARQLADLDALTGLHNRRYFHETLEREVARAQRYERRLALIVFDLDDFKAINDRIGHLAGDAVLAEAAERVRERRPLAPTSPAASAATSSR